jgi:hypothetical protein
MRQNILISFAIVSMVAFVSLVVFTRAPSDTGIPEVEAQIVAGAIPGIVRLYEVEFAGRSCIVALPRHSSRSVGLDCQ